MTQEKILGNQLNITTVADGISANATAINTIATGVTTNGLELIEFSETNGAFGLTGPVDIDASTSTYYAAVGAAVGIITFTFSNPAGIGRTTTVTIKLNNAASYNPVWPAEVVWPNGIEPTWTTGVDIVSFMTDDNGTTWYGALGGLDFS